MQQHKALSDSTEAFLEFISGHNIDQVAFLTVHVVSDQAEFIQNLTGCNAWPDMLHECLVILHDKTIQVALVFRVLPIDGPHARHV